MSGEVTRGDLDPPGATRVFLAYGSLTARLCLPLDREVLTASARTATSADRRRVPSPQPVRKNGIAERSAIALRSAGDESRHRGRKTTEPLHVGANGFYSSKGAEPCH
jgi:hypothetical protein